MTFDLSESWVRSLKSRNRAQNTIDSYLLSVRLLCEFTGKDAAKADRADIEAFIADQLATRAPSTAGIRYRSLVQFFNWLVSEDEIESHPMSRMSPPSIPEVPVPVVDDDTLRRLLSVCEGKGFNDRRDTAIFRLFIDTPCRLSEIAYLNLDDIDWGENTIKVLAKGSKVRTNPIGPQSVVALDRYIRVRRGHKASRSTALWLGTRGPMTRWGLPQMLERRCHEAGVPKLHFHQLRHTWAHEWLSAGGNETDLMRLAGWSSRAMVARYGASAADERARQAYRSRLPGERI